MQPAQATFDSPLGPITILAVDGALTRLYWSGKASTSPEKSSGNNLEPLLGQAREQLDAYFSGTLRDFDLPLAPTGSPFQQRVWEALYAIPYGQTRSGARRRRRLWRQPYSHRHTLPPRTRKQRKADRVFRSWRRPRQTTAP